VKLSNFQKRKLGRKKSWVSFKGKTIQLDFEPRIGICSMCGKNDERTSLHHTQYDESDPLKYTIEICCGCHNKIHKRNLHKNSI
jgi:hypothetical protein